MESNVIDLKPLLDVGLQLLGAVLLALGSWAATWVVKKLKLSADSEIRAYLDQALQRAIAFAIEKARTRGEDLARIEVRSRIVADAANYAIERVPDALEHFGLSADAVAKLIAARLPAPGGP